MTEEDYLLIEKKIDGTLTTEEARAFDRRQTEDKEFAEAYALQQSAIDTFRREHPQRLKEEMRAMHEEMKAERRQQQESRRPYAIAAVVALLLVATSLFFFLRTPSSQDLYAEYYHPYRATIVGRGASPEQKNQTEQLYSEGRFAEAIPLLQTLVAETDGTETDRWRLILGNAYLQMDSTTQALDQFEQITDADYQPYARWYTAMSHLKAEDTDAAQKVLQLLANQPSPFRSKAQQLLNEL